MMPLLYIKVDDDDDDDDDDVRTHNKNVMLCKEGSQSVVVGKSDSRVFFCGLPASSLLKKVFFFFVFARSFLYARARVCVPMMMMMTIKMDSFNTHKERETKKDKFLGFQIPSRNVWTRECQFQVLLSRQVSSSAFVKGTL